MLFSLSGLTNLDDDEPTLPAPTRLSNREREAQPAPPTSTPRQRRAGRLLRARVAAGQSGWALLCVSLVGSDSRQQFWIPLYTAFQIIYSLGTCVKVFIGVQVYAPKILRDQVHRGECLGFLAASADWNCSWISSSGLVSYLTIQFIQAADSISVSLWWELCFHHHRHFYRV